MSSILRKAIFGACIGILSVLAVCAVFFSYTHRELMPYRLYNVLTDSMEPTIGTNSLVLVKTYRSGMEIKKDDIITFSADRFGEKIIIMHRFSHTEINDSGKLVYRTYPEGSHTLDSYETAQDDILGVYVWHIPYAGKLLLFLKSSFGLLWICQTAAILFIKEWLVTGFKKRGVL